MNKKSLKMLAIVACAGTMFQFGGCFGGWLGQVVTYVTSGVVSDFLTDNDGIFDLFQD